MGGCSSRIFFLAIWWAGYFFPFFSHKLSITFCAACNFFLPTRACRRLFFKITTSPPPRQELNSQLLIRISQGSRFMVIRSCRLNTPSRQGIKQLGISFGSIYLHYPMKVAMGHVHNSRGKSSAPSSL